MPGLQSRALTMTASVMSPPDHRASSGSTRITRPRSASETRRRKAAARRLHEVCPMGFVRVPNLIPERMGVHDFGM